MADLSVLSEHLGGLLQQIEPAQRWKLSSKIGQELRKKQQQRIVQQKNPDGSSYVPRRKNKLRDKKGRIKNQMFLKIKNTKFLRLKNESDRVAIGFAGRVANIARVHQYGLRDRPDAKIPEVRYAKRELLGFASGDLSWIEDRVLQHLESGL